MSGGHNVLFPDLDSLYNTRDRKDRCSDFGNNCGTDLALAEILGYAENPCPIAYILDHFLSDSYGRNKRHFGQRILFQKLSSGVQNL